MINPMISTLAKESATGELQNVQVGGGLKVRDAFGEYRVTGTEFKEAVDKIETYKTGDDRTHLLHIEELVREAQYINSDRSMAAGVLANVVYGSATKDAKAFACRQLWIIGTPEIVSVLAVALKDPALSDMARYALQNMEYPEVDDALIAALDGTPANVQIGCINSLAMRKSPAAIDAIKPLRKSKDKDVEAAAKHALARLEGKIVP